MATSLWYTLNGPSENRTECSVRTGAVFGLRATSTSSSTSADLAIRARTLVEIIAPGAQATRRSTRKIGDGQLLVRQRLARRTTIVDWTAAPVVQAKAQVVDGLWTTDANRAALRNDGV
jgi:hypothetical protein